MHIGFVGWRGMVGSILMRRIAEQIGFDKFTPYFFSTSQSNTKVSIVGSEVELYDAYDCNMLSDLDVVITCQGSDYTQKIHSQLRSKNWRGYWVDAASALRMNDSSTIALDPINRTIIEEALENGCKDFIGGNCTVSLLLMAIDGLIKNDSIEWISSMTYQAISGAGSVAMKELLKQQAFIAQGLPPINESSSVAMEHSVRELIAHRDFPQSSIGGSLATDVLPWIDSDLGSGQSREEWKVTAETNKILGWKSDHLKIDGICARVASLRCHAQALVIKLKYNSSLQSFLAMLRDSHEWLQIIDNNKQSSLAGLSSSAISGSLNIAIGRIRQMSFDKNCFSAYTIGDQLLWGAAEPLVRMLQILLDRRDK